MPQLRSLRGFTLVELITIVILIGILAAVALPRFDSVRDFGALAFRDRTATSLRYAQKSAVAKRRMVCATVAAGTLTLTVADTFGGACNTPMPGPDGADPAAVSPSADVQLAPVGTLRFQPSGAITSDVAGTAPATGTITVTGQAAINIRGATGYVD